MAGEQSDSDKQRELEEQVRRLKTRNAELEKRLAQLEEENRKLKTQLARASTTSRNSSKRPSSDIVKPKRAVPGSPRKIGAQPGHENHQRTPFGPEAIDRFIAHAMGCCPDCGGPVHPLAGVAPVVVQQMELGSLPLTVTEHQAGWYWCAKCQKRHCSLPLPIQKEGLCGPVLTAWIGYLKGACHMSFDCIRKFLRDLLHVRVSKGLLAILISKVSAALATPWEELRMLLPLAKLLNVDETGHKENGQRLYTWCFRARDYILFKIAECRGTAVLLEMLGADFDGIIGCDYFSSYRCYMREFGGVLQFCLAHLIRDVKFLLDLPDAATRAYGQRFLGSLRDLFAIIHRREEMTELGFQRCLEHQRREILRVALTAVPSTPEARNLAARMRQDGESYFRFITTPGLEPTNNLAEQAIRFVVIDRHVTQGTRSQKGREWCERIWTILATCEQQGVSAFNFIRDAVQAYFVGAPAPSLVAASP
jgi:transposase